ncbi:helix-turn-helix domain-containing protein [Burkholderia plantarii]|nr:LysR family transcriptional regulator [Burkholderia plantarii]
MLERIHLVIIRGVARQGSLTAAADALFLTRSALSHAVKKIE